MFKGIVFTSFGALILGWFGYNYLVEMQPGVEGRSPLPGMIFSCACLFYGIKSFKKSKD